MDKVLKKSYDLVLNDERFVKLTFFALLPYSLIFVGYIFYQTYFFILTLNEGFHLYDIKVYVEKIFSAGEQFWFIFFSIVGIILILYFLFPPIAEASLINYLHKKDKSISKCLGKGFIKFFPMFELHGFLSLFSFLFFFIVVSRLYIANMLDSTFVIPLLVIWFLFVLFFNFATIYAKYLIVIENKDMFEAVRESIKLSFLNISITGKYFLIQLILYIRFLINIIILVGVPILVLYLFLKSGVGNLELVKYSIFFIMFLLFLITAYVNSIIEAFFISMWYNIFNIIEKDSDE